MIPRLLHRKLKIILFIKTKKKKARLFQEDMLIHAANTVNHFLYLPP